MRISNFWKIEAWQEARILTKSIYNETNGNPAFNKDYNLCRQIQRAAVSTMANIAEDFARRSDADFARYLNIALGSNTEKLINSFISYLRK